MYLQKYIKIRNLAIIYSIYIAYKKNIFFIIINTI